MCVCVCVCVCVKRNDRLPYNGAVSLCILIGWEKDTIYWNGHQSGWRNKTPYQTVIRCLLDLVKIDYYNANRTIPPCLSLSQCIYIYWELNIDVQKDPIYVCMSVSNLSIYLSIYLHTYIHTYTNSYIDR